MFVNFLRSFSLVTGTAATVVNFLVLCTIYSLKKSTVGVYRIFLFAYIAQNLFCALVTVAFSPIISVNEYSFVIFATGLTGYQYFGSICLMCFCFSVMGLVVILTVSYVYRYFIICCFDQIQMFMSKGLIFVAIGASIVFFTTIFASFVWMQPTAYKNSIFAPHFTEHFGILEINGTSYIGAISYTNNVLEQDFGFIFIVRILNFSIPMAIIAFCSYHIIMSLRQQFSLVTASRAGTTRQFRLFLLLILQSLFPMLLCFVPLCILFFSALLRYKNFPMCDFLSLLLTFSQLLDPLIVLFCVSDYRQAANNLLRKLSSSYGINDASSSSGMTAKTGSNWR